MSDNKEEVKPVVKEEPVLGADGKPITDVPYARFKKMLDEKAAAETKLLAVTTQIEADKRAAEDQKLKDANDYTTLMKKVEAERAVEKAKVTDMVKSTYLQYLGVKSGILKPEYTALFDKQIEVEGLEIKNAAATETAFTEFKTANPTLFGEVKPVAKVDNQPPKTPSITMDPDKMSATERWALALEDRDRNKK